MAPQHDANNDHIITSQPTEIDQLLEPVHDRKLYPIKTSRHAQIIRPLIVAIAAVTAVMLLSTVYAELKHRGVPPKKNDQTYMPRKQINVLNGMTISKVNEEFSKKKIHLVQTQEKKSSSTGKWQKMTVCTSQLMIMRHCEKEKKVKVDGGLDKTTDTTDMFGNRHCSKKGLARSEYISTLFADPEQYNASLYGNENEAEAWIKPQFSPPLKLYALSESRYKRPAKHHKNFREIETVTPTARKFHLDVDERFGDRDEGDLAMDFFQTLSQSAAKSVDSALTMKMTLNATEPYAAEESRDICNGMVVVNWKHSRIANLSAALGCGKEQGCPQKYHGKDFDVVWLLTFQYSIKMGSESKKSHSRHYLKNSPISVNGGWKVSAQLVNEGFTS
eukprot:CAMPEP_0201737216 /NCGR_PEP_ID=MMETSP0593-20130828/41786_1 /ASSEMBLY_ACC=CAM_ASM_000672 /TAXON_ID=267983 /ORGANISM="Skeletonema japonicum, Strain CCMP2506" /LENGTH=388 /DNA_ID=CAMNT_0048231153 /DNA_START=46 /DNA_END=1208 /DNA_ORIENTATION=+